MLSIRHIAAICDGDLIVVSEWSVYSSLLHKI